MTSADIFFNLFPSTLSIVSLSERALLLLDESIFTWITAYRVSPVIFFSCQL